MTPKTSRTDQREPTVEFAVESLFPIQLLAITL